VTSNSFLALAGRAEAQFFLRGENGAPARITIRVLRSWRTNGSHLSNLKLIGNGDDRRVVDSRRWAWEAADVVGELMGFLGSVKLFCRDDPAKFVLDVDYEFGWGAVRGCCFRSVG